MIRLIMILSMALLVASNVEPHGFEVRLTLPLEPRERATDRGSAS